MIRPLQLVSILGAGPLVAQGTAGIDSRVAAIAPRMIEFRHQIHQHPELGNREARTAALIAAELERLGLEVRTGIAYTGVIGILRGAKPGPVVAIRADMDGLPVTEATDLPFRSIDTVTYLGRPTGVSHACGHDTHVAAQLGVANLLAGMRDRLS
ncbi:MAG: amidohydrolase, partial [Gemmatimonadota bacterium]|nr:amidohydrolase [Gemmatimonadota bacterium]